MKRKKIIYIILSIILLILLTVGGIFTYFYYRLSKNKTIVKKEKPITPIEKKETPKYKEIEGITNILLLSSDARPGEKNSRSDSIIILTIDNNRKKVKLTSLMRDMLVEIPSHGEEKLNHAFAYGGADLISETIENNFNIKINNYAIIDFKGFKEVVDSLGGVDIDIKKYELDELNKYIVIDGLGTKEDCLKNIGMQHLNGTQALSYARIRKVGDGDYERTARQRKLIGLLANKLKTTNVLKLPFVADKLIPNIKTNLSMPEILDLGYTILQMKFDKIENYRLPHEEFSCGKIINKKGWVLLVDKQQTSKDLNNFIFNDSKNFKYNRQEYNTCISNYLNKYSNNIFKPSSKHYEEELDTYIKNHKKTTKIGNNILKKNDNIISNNKKQENLKNTEINKKDDVKKENIKQEKIIDNNIKNNIKSDCIENNDKTNTEKSE